MNIEQQLYQKFGLKIPQAAAPGGLYSPVIKTGNLLYLSGQTPKKEGIRIFTGIIGRDFTVEQGQEAARYTMLNCLAVLKDYLGDLEKIKQFIQVVGYVRSAEGFTDQPTVMNGASGLLLDIFGDRGRHTRLALGTNELPGGSAVEIMCIVEI